MEPLSCIRCTKPLYYKSDKPISVEDGIAQGWNKYVITSGFHTSGWYCPRCSVGYLDYKVKEVKTYLNICLSTCFGASVFYIISLIFLGFSFIGFLANATWISIVLALAYYFRKQYLSRKNDLEIQMGKI
jgi:hypothetical protein